MSTNDILGLMFSILEYFGVPAVIKVVIVAIAAITLFQVLIKRL